MLGSTAKFPPFWSSKPRKHHSQSIGFTITVASLATRSHASGSSLDDLPLQFLVHTCLVICNSKEVYSPARSGIVELTTDIGIKGLRIQIWDLLRLNKYTHEYMPWEDYNAKFVVGAKWMVGNVRVPDAVLETDSEVRSAIELMVDRRAMDHFSVTCYLTPKMTAEDPDTESQDDNEGLYNTEEAGGRWQVDRGDTKKRTKGKSKAWDEEGKSIERW